MYTLEGVRSVANFIIAYKESLLDRNSHYLISSMFFVSKGNVLTFISVFGVKFSKYLNKRVFAMAIGKTLSPILHGLLSF